MSIFSVPPARTFSIVLLLVATILFTVVATVSVQSPRFYADDPISRVPESQNAQIAVPFNPSQLYELVYNLFVNPSYKPSGLRAQNINTIDEVPDSSWFTNRIGHSPISL